MRRTIRSARVLASLLLAAGCTSPKVADLTCAEGQIIIWTSGQWTCRSASTLQGSSGGTGITGAAGATGVTGSAGITGVMGGQGATGATGPGGAGVSGPTGATGATGSAGTSGLSGLTGVTGASGIGLAGATGPTGVAGSAGASGTTGSTGSTGASAVAQLPVCASGQLLSVTSSGWQCLTLQPGLKISGGVISTDNTCPPGYVVGGSASDLAAEYTVCTKTVGHAQTDELVGVGAPGAAPAFWIDRYELSGSISGGVCGNNSNGAADGYGTTAIGCSVSGVQVAVNVSWFQAAQMCVNAGKRLCTNDEWQAAVSGTIDPGSAPNTTCNTGAVAGAGPCNTCSGGVRATGLGAASAGGVCYSTFGAEDMIGNAWEWTAQWSQAGPVATTSDGYVATPWPSTYGDGQNATGNVNATVQTYTTADTAGLPAAALRGGCWANGSSAGAFTFNLAYGPTYLGPAVTGRCCVGGR